MKTSEQINELATAMAKAQGEMGSATKGAANPFFKSKYADLSEVVRAIKEPLAANGLSYVQFPIRDGESAGVTTRLMHSSGQWMESEYTLPLQKFDAQAVGSAITYSRRYALQAIAGIPAEDDDGNQATAGAPVARPSDVPPAAPDPRLKEISQHIKEGIELGDSAVVWEIWNELSDADKSALWVAFSKGGFFSQAEKNFIRSSRSAAV